MTTRVSSSPVSPAAPVAVRPAFRWVVCALLLAATTINYMDRQVLGLLAPLLQSKIGWDDLQYSHIVIAFQSAYAIGLLCVSYVIDRWGTKRGYSLAIIVWSIAACLHGAARSVGQFASARFVLGLGESGNFPSAIKAVATWFGPSERALATGVFNSGSNLGAIAAPALVPWIAVRFGWQAAFISLGAAGFLWVVLWAILYREPSDDRSDKSANSYPPVDPAPSTARPRLLELLRLRQTWGFILISITGQPVGWFFLYWLPKFFSAQFNLSISHLGLPLVIVYSMALAGGIFGGALPALFLARDCSLNVSRKGSLLICAMLMVPVAFATQAPNLWAATFMIGVGLAALQGWAANCYSVVADLFPKESVASVVGLGSFFGSLAGVAFAELAGLLLQASSNYTPLFVIAGLGCPAGLAVLHLLAPRWQPADREAAWPNRRRSVV